MKTSGLWIRLGAIAVFGILAPLPALADSFELLDSLPSAHGIYYCFLTPRANFIALGDGSENRNGVEIVDASDPTDLESAGFDTAFHMTYSLDWDGDYLYIPGCWDGFYIYDVSNLNNFVLASRTPRPGAFPIVGVAIRNGFAYIGADNNGLGGSLYCMAVFDPYRPAILWNSDTLDCSEIFPGQSLLYSYSWCHDIRIIDILNPTEPRQITRLECTYINSMDIDETRDLMYVTCFDYGLKIYDISNPLAPNLLSTTQMPNRATCIDVCHSKAYHQIIFVSGYDRGLWALDTSNPTRPIPTASYFPSGGQCNFVMPRGNLVFLTTPDCLISLRYIYGTGIEETNAPASFSLMQNYPNPFNSGTSISCILPQCSNIRLEIYDALGRKVQTLYEGFQNTGNAAFQWDASLYPSGNYFYGLTVEGKSEYRKMTLIK